MPTKNFFSFLSFLLITIRFEATFTSFTFTSKTSQNSRNQGFSFYFCSMIEGSGYVPRTNGSGSERSKNITLRERAAWPAVICGWAESWRHAFCRWKPSSCESAWALCFSNETLRILFWKSNIRWWFITGGGGWGGGCLGLLLRVPAQRGGRVRHVSPHSLNNNKKKNNIIMKIIIIKILELNKIQLFKAIYFSIQSGTIL